MQTMRHPHVHVILFLPSHEIHAYVVFTLISYMRFGQNSYYTFQNAY